MKNTVVISLVVLAVIAGVVYASLSKPVPENSPAVSVSPTSADVTSDKSMGDVPEIVVEGSDYKFVPSTITVKKGEKTKILFKNIKGVHDFNVDELGINTEIIETGQEESVEFTADQVGSFEFYCSFGQHRQMGMKGTLVVEE